MKRQGVFPWMWTQVRKARTRGDHSLVFGNEQVAPSTLDIYSEQGRGALTCGDPVRLCWVQFVKLPLSSFLTLRQAVTVIVRVKNKNK